jgi:hypothetical protein
VPLGDHIKAPFVHLIPPGRTRIKYLQFFYSAGVIAKDPGKSSLESAVRRDQILQHRDFYRFKKEIVASATSYFTSCELDTGGLVRAGLDLGAVAKKPTKRLLARILRLCEGPGLNLLTTYLRNAAFVMSNPDKTPSPENPYSL